MLETPVASDISSTTGKQSIADYVVSRLSRVTSSGRFVPEIDGLRFFAIAGVVLAHIAGVLASHSTYAGTGITASALYSHLETWTQGVRLFFSISGFILALPFAEAHLRGRPKPNLVRYYTRRVTRLEPPYIICLTVGLIGICVYGGQLHKEFWHYVASLFYSHGFVYRTPSTIGGILWSLEVEVQFYVLAPILARVFLLKCGLRRLILVAAILGGAILHSTVWSDRSAYVHLTILGNFQFFLVGFLAVDMYLSHWNTQSIPRIRWDLAVLLAYIVTTVLPHYYIVPWYNYTFPIMVYLGYVSAFRGRIASSVLRNRWLVIIGGMCYTIYLYHMIIIRLLWTMIGQRLVVTNTYVTDYLVQLAIMCPIVLVVTSLLFVSCEKPFMQRDWPSQWRGAIRSRMHRHQAKGR